MESAQGLQIGLFFLVGIVGIIEPILPVTIAALAIAAMVAARLAMTLNVVWTKDDDKAWVITSLAILAVSALISSIIFLGSFYEGLAAIGVIGVPLTFLQFLIFGFRQLISKHFGKAPEIGGIKGIPRQGKEFVKHLDALYASVPSGKKSPIARQVKRIRETSIQAFGVIDKNPELSSKAHELMDYCLPQTLKLMDNYLEFTKKRVKGENIEKILADIVKSFDVMSEAMDKQLNNLYAGMVLDVKTDMAVTKNIK